MPGGSAAARSWDRHPSRRDGPALPDQPADHLDQLAPLGVLDAPGQAALGVVVEHRYGDLRDDRPGVPARVHEAQRPTRAPYPGSAQASRSACRLLPEPDTRTTNAAAPTPVPYRAVSAATCAGGCPFGGAQVCLCVAP